jgi:anti-sigma factor RsiW
MTCLNDIQIQALADGEGPAEASRHAHECDACGARLRERARTMTAIRHAIDVPVAVPPHLARTIEDAFRLKAEAT